MTGTNVVAAEFHKYAANSTYLAFSAELSADATLAVTAPASAAPASLTATVAGTGVQLAWTASAGAASYEVRRDGTPIATVTGTAHTDAAPGVGTFTYTVRALDAGGRTPATLLSPRRLSTRRPLRRTRQHPRCRPSPRPGPSRPPQWR